MAKLEYQSGFANEFATEAIAGALPKGQNAPQKSTLGLYTEQFSGTPFTAPRAVSRRSWLYRIRPSVTHRPFVELPDGNWTGERYDELPATPNQLRWDPLPIPSAPRDFLDGIITMAKRQPGWTNGVRGAHLRCQSKHVRTVLFECGWRDADPAPGRQAAVLH